MTDADDTAAATETWHRHPVHLNRPALCLCEDDLHRNQHVMLLPSVEIRDAILRLRDEARDLRESNEVYEALFDMQYKRLMDASERWRAADPEDRALTIKDLGDLLDWLHDEARDAQQLRYDLRNLLAVIHRDGGHYFTDHGQEKAVKDGMEKVVNTYAALEASTTTQAGET